MIKVCVIGHFGYGKELVNGQTIKTKNVTNELESQFSESQVMKIDTHGGIKRLPEIIGKMIYAFIQCKNIIILPAHNGIKLFVPLCTLMNSIFHRELHYVVIGGWLNTFLNGHRKLERKLKKFTGIYVETMGMKNTLQHRGFRNVEVMPNFKDIQVLRKDELVYTTTEPLKVCTFSRVIKEKGIEEAIAAVTTINTKYGRVIFSLDIYGQIENEQMEWFEKIEHEFPMFVKYKGMVPFDQSVEVLKNYYALLFPTYYEGEGFAGTLIDAMAAGVPAIVSNWKYNKEIVVQGKTGILIKARNQDSLNEALEHSLDISWNTMKTTCIEEAMRYVPDKAIKILLMNLE